MAFDWKNLIAKTAPMLATALGGPLAGAAVAAIGESLGLGPGATEAEISKKLAAASPETLLELKKAEQAFAVQMAELGFKNESDLARLANDDRASARSREMSLADWTPRVLAALVTMGFFGAIMLLALVPTEASREPLLVLVGTLGTAWTQIVAYYFGSTAGGQRKTDLLARSGINT